ncbi:hypothetical protein GW17_00040826 [Ensete ventricosum]|nr:hypothetical protein GW17_00040826 [Ensete ventricosum]
MAPSLGRLGIVMNNPSSTHKSLHEYRILSYNNSPHLFELYTTLSVAEQPIPPYTVSSFTKHPTCLKGHQVWLPISSRSSNSAIPTSVHYIGILPSSFILMVPLTRRVDYSSEC